MRYGVRMEPDWSDIEHANEWLDSDEKMAHVRFCKRPVFDRHEPEERDEYVPLDFND